MSKMQSIDVDLSSATHFVSPKALELASGAPGKAAPLQELPQASRMSNAQGHCAVTKSGWLVLGMSLPSILSIADYLTIL